MITRTSGALPQPDQSCTALAVNLVDEDISSLAGMLRGSNWIVKKVRTCQEALDFSRKGPASVVLCEPHMPDGSWTTLMEKLRELSAPTTVIVVSRLADEHLWAEVLNLGGYDVLATPFDKSEVYRVLFLAWEACKRNGDRMPAGLRKRPAAARAAEPGLSQQRRAQE